MTGTWPLAITGTKHAEEEFPDVTLEPGRHGRHSRALVQRLWNCITRNRWKKYVPNILPQFLERFGYYDTFALPTGTIGIIAAMTVLISLWEFGNRPTTEAHIGFWSKFVVDGWATRTTTISCAILRICLAAQSFTCCYMVASLVLEYDQVAKGNDTKLMTIYQSVNAGPNDIMMLLLKRFSFERNQIGLAVAALMALSILVSQMFSTILISDMNNIIIPGNNLSTKVLYDQDVSYPLKSSLETFPSEYPLFAEHATSPFFVKGNQSSPGLSDSGGVVRAFFPLKSPERQSISSYSGPASVAELHYICFPPEMSHHNATYTVDPDYLPPWYKLLLTGRLKFPSQLNEYTKLLARDLPSLGNFNWTSSYWEFNCTLAFSTFTTCVLDGPIFDNGTWGREAPFNLSPHWNLVFSSQYPVSVGTAGAAYEGEWGTTTITFTIENSTVEESRGVKIFRPRIIVPIKYSLCLGWSIPSDRNIVAEVASNVTEPVLGQLRVDNTMNTTAIQNQLGVATHNARDTDHQSRGIFDMKSNDRLIPVSYSYGPPRYWSAMNWCIYPPNNNNESFKIGCAGITGDTNGYELGKLNPVFNALFINTLRDTGKLVFAIEAVQTLLYASAYYQTMFAFDMEAQATMTLFTLVLVPRRWRGLIVVGSFVSLHFILLASVIWVYVSSRSFRSQSSTNTSYEALENGGKNGRKYIGDSADPLVVPLEDFETQTPHNEYVGEQTISSVVGDILTTIRDSVSSMRHRATL
jgi:hypothetical protein